MEDKGKDQVLLEEVEHEGIYYYYQADVIEGLGTSRSTLSRVVKELGIDTIKIGVKNAIRVLDFSLIRDRMKSKKTESVLSIDANTIQAIPKPQKSVTFSLRRNVTWEWAVYVFALFIETTTMMSLIAKISFPEGELLANKVLYYSQSFGLALVLYLGLFTMTLNAPLLEKKGNGRIYVWVFVFFNATLNILRLFEQETTSIFNGIAKVILGIGVPIIILVLHEVLRLKMKK